MDKALTDAAIKAIDALITDELSTSSPGRYDHIIGIATTASSPSVPSLGTATW